MSRKTRDAISAAYISWCAGPSNKWEFYSILDQHIRARRVTYSQAAQITRDCAPAIASKKPGNWGTGVSVDVLKMRVHTLRRMA